jgi:hypothetical protein
MVAGRRTLFHLALVSLLLACPGRNGACARVTPRRSTSFHENALQLQAASHLSKVDVDLLIRDFDLPDNQREFRREAGLLTVHTRETRVLIRHADDAYVSLLAALGNNSIHVRRYSAFCIGEIRRRDAVPYLQRAIADELRVATQASGDEFNPATLAMVNAYIRIAGRAAIDWLLDVNLAPEALARANDQIARHLPFAPKCEAVSPSQCRALLATYWRVHARDSDPRLFVN